VGVCSGVSPLGCASASRVTARDVVGTSCARIIHKSLCCLRHLQVEYRICVYTGDKPGKRHAAMHHTADTCCATNSLQVATDDAQCRIPETTYPGWDGGGPFMRCASALSGDACMVPRWPVELYRRGWGLVAPAHPHVRAHPHSARILTHAHTMAGASTDSDVCCRLHGAQQSAKTMRLSDTNAEATRKYSTPTRPQARVVVRWMPTPLCCAAGTSSARKRTSSYFGPPTWAS
jgi:hypothetical protein